MGNEILNKCIWKGNFLCHANEPTPLSKSSWNKQIQPNNLAETLGPSALPMSISELISQDLYLGFCMIKNS